jgi:hypothetical protein
MWARVLSGDPTELYGKVALADTPFYLNSTRLAAAYPKVYAGRDVSKAHSHCTL